MTTIDRLTRLQRLIGRAWDHAIANDDYDAGELTATRMRAVSARLATLVA